MTINERLFKTMNEKKVKQIDLANALGIKQQIVNNWKTRGTNPAMEYLPQICETLDISWEYLVTGENRQPHYSAEEQRLISEYRNCNEVGKGRIREYAQEMRKLHPEQNREPETETKIS